MILHEWLPVLVIHGYALGTAGVVAGFLSHRAWLKRVAFALFAVSFVGHTVILAGVFMQGEGGVSLSAPESFPRYVYLLALAWCVMLAGLVARLYPRYEALLLCVAPVNLAVFLMALLLRGAVSPLLPSLSGMFFSVHIGSLFIAFGLVALASGAGLLFLLQERSLKAKTAPSLLCRDLPALTMLDAINSWAVRVGFPLFTVGLLFGFVGARLVWGTLLSGDPKEWVSLGIWGLFAWLYHQRMVKGWQGHKPAVLVIWVFVISVFSLTVVNLFMPTHHSFFSVMR